MTKSLPGFDPGFGHNAFVRFCKEDSAIYDIKQMPELPSTQLSVKICLRQTPVPDALIAELRTSHKLALTQSPPPRSDTVVISGVIYGIPGETPIGREQILQIVQEFAPKAELLPQENEQNRG